MKILLLAPALLLGAAWSAQATAHEATSTVAHWKYFGADPSYPSREAAMKDADHTMQRMGWAEGARELMLTQLKQAGTKVMITKGDVYDHMRSGASALWGRTLVDFAKPPVKGVPGVEYAVEGERWTIEYNGRTYELTLPKSCENWLDRVFGESPCAIVNMEVRTPAEYAVAWERTQTATDQCWSVRKVTALYQPETVGPAFQPLKPGCIGPPCTFADFNRLNRYDLKSEGTYVFQGPGIYQWLIAPGEIPAWCLKRDLGNGVIDSSFTNGVRWGQDYKLVNGQMQARIYYKSDEAFADGHTIGAPMFLTWWATTVQDQARIRGNYTVASAR